MKLMLVQPENINDCLIVTSLLKIFNKDYDIIDVLVNDKNCASIFRFNKEINKVYIINKLPNNIENIEYDKVINFSPAFSDNIINFNSNDKSGFNYDLNINKCYQMLYCNKKTDKNIYQIYFNVAGLNWKGERPNFKYFPRNKLERDKIGLCLVNKNLKDYVMNKLKLSNSKLWIIPPKKNILKRSDYLNVCPSIITDDFLTMNLSINFNKEVFFLKTLPYNFKIENFNQGEIFTVPYNIIQ